MMDLFAQDSGQSSPRRRANKRRKTAMACQYCRNRKIKCDGIRPICGACRKRQRTENECIWVHVDGRTDDSHVMMQSLQTRIEQLEKRSTSRLFSSASASTRQHDVQSNSAVKTFQATNDTERSHYGITALEGAVTGEAQNEGFVGSSSTAWFVNLIRRKIDPSSVISSSASRISPISTTRRENESSKNRSLHIYPNQPSRLEADALISLYWEYVHPLYPFLHKKSFETTYENFWRTQSVPETPSSSLPTSEAEDICTVYLVLALGCQYSYTFYDARGSTVAEAYFDRAREYFRYDPIDSPEDSIRLVRVMLLISQYLRSMGQTNKAWDVIGLAIRTCQRLGFHTAITTVEYGNSIERELIRRVWHGCLMFEIMLCMALGRPAMVSTLSSDVVPLPQEVDEEEFQETCMPDGPGNCVQASGVSAAHESLLSFFVHSAKLYDIVQDVLRSFYADDRKRRAPSLSSYFIGSGSVFELDGRLIEWYVSVPSHIQLEHIGRAALLDDERLWTFYRQAVVLRLRYLQARLYLLRPVLAKVCTAGKDQVTETQSADLYESTEASTSLVERTALQCSFICVKAALELIEIANDHQTTAERWGQKPSWLYGVQLLYLAATVLLAARLAPATTLGEIPDSKIQESWEHALQLLRGFSSDSLSAQRCVTALEVLYRKLPGSRLANNSTSQSLEIVELTIPHTNGSTGVLPTNESTEDELQFWQTETPEWTADFDFSNPYDMSWFQLAPDMSIA